MSLAFLAKKSWHTSNLRNVEKVWIAEQKAAAEEKKLAELKKNYEEERQIQELRKLQAAHGNKAAAVERLDWMYQGPMASANTERTAEEYLLGKEYKPDEPGADDRKLGDTAYGALALTKAVLPSNDAFSRLNEDPMMLIRSQQKRAQEEVLKNPMKMKKIKGEVEKLLKEKKDKKKAKKQAKKERKLAKKAKRSDSIHSEDSNHNAPRQREQRRGSRSPVRERGSSRDQREHSPMTKRRRDRRSPSRSRSRTRGRSPRRRSSSADRYHSRDRRRSPSEDRSRRTRCRSRDSFGRTIASPARRRSPPSHNYHRRSDRSSVDRSRHSSRRSPSPRRRSRSGSPQRDRRRDSDRDRPRDRHDHDKGRRDRSPATKDRARDASSPARKEYVVNRPDDGGKYGLIRKEGALESQDIDRSTLGPNAKFLEQVREKKRLEAEELRRKLGKTQSAPRSHEEMLKQAAQMAEDAKAREAFLTKRAAEKREKLDDEEAKLREDPQFLKQLQDAVYTKGESSMEDRLRRNAHYVQRRAEASNFLSKD